MDADDETIGYFVGMAIRQIVESDISGNTDASTVSFGFEGTWYEVDLTAQEREELKNALSRYFKIGRKTGPRPNPKRAVPDTTPEQREIIRQWAKDEGFEIADRGVIPKQIFAAYKTEHGGLPQV